MKILADASLPLLQALFPYPFELTTYHNLASLHDQLPHKEILLCRSTLTIGENFSLPSSLKYIATASSGSDHLNKLYLQSQHIELVDAKGSNAEAVADYVLACLAYLQQQQDITQKKVGIIGFGAVGAAVYSNLCKLGIKPILYDPLKAAHNSQFKSSSWEALLACDLICIHANLHEEPLYPSLNLLNKEALQQLPPKTIIINAARGGIIDEEALIDLIPTRSLIYCADVYLGEPAINKKLLSLATLCTPHIAGHSIEAKQNAIEMISQKLHALYQLPAKKPFVPAVFYNRPFYNQQWAQHVLSIYNPERETQLLKKAHNIKEVFLNTRQAHTFRHHFSLNW